MDELTRISIRRIFLTSRPHVSFITAADRLGISFLELKSEIAEGTIVAVSTGVGRRVAKEEMIAAAMRTWPQSVIEEALGEDATRVMPEAIRLVELRARVPRYQKEMLQWLARRNETSVDAVLTRELDDVVCAYAEEILLAMPEFEVAMAWPEAAASAATEDSQGCERSEQPLVNWRGGFVPRQRHRSNENSIQCR